MHLAVGEDPDSSTLWHQGVGHMSEKGMKEIVSKGRILGLEKVTVGFDEQCIPGKQKKVTFVKSGKSPKLGKLELIHIDVYGPTSVASNRRITIVCYQLHQ